MHGQQNVKKKSLVFHKISHKKIYPVETELLHAEGQTDRQTHVTDVTGDFRDWANASKEKMN